MPQETLTGIYLQIPVDLKRHAKSIAERNGISWGKYCEMAIREYSKYDDQKSDSEQQKSIIEE
jgi:hypothetical protein